MASLSQTTTPGCRLSFETTCGQYEGGDYTNRAFTIALSLGARTLAGMTAVP
ncbi:MAG: hypothetical protein LKJ50_10520 [Clostridiales bacterium]|nr:hypothetical protein [Clostridiales bacterium]MCI2160791.1 hypothetical protein [Oscillospiraceae bacterium]MCI1962373.1 hypothetical protein [Clostridiales bacterium]MCI2022815.1 hypothetical protein [Clostridiales bacterium]MCI2027212.1 hypothetical protein [Clostridiales bacterium]